MEKYGIKLRVVEESDAEFILQLRTDEKKSRFISKTIFDIEKQKEWIRAYKEREKAGEEYYFIAVDSEGESFATYRIYNKKNDTIEIGSFISLYNYPKFKNIIKLDILIKEFVFKNLKYIKLNFDVRKKNISVINYHKKLGGEIISENDLSYYMELYKEKFNLNKLKFQRMLN